MVEGSLWIEVFLNRSVCFINPQIFTTAATKASCIHQFRANPSSSLITTHKPSGLISPCLHISSCPHVHRLLKSQHTNFSLYFKHDTAPSFISYENTTPIIIISSAHHTASSFLFLFKNTSPVLTYHPMKHPTPRKKAPLQPHNPNPHIDTHTHGTKPHLWRKMTTIWLLPFLTHNTQKTQPLPFDHLMKPFKPSWTAVTPYTWLNLGGLQCRGGVTHNTTKIRGLRICVS
jgi:hypothetical protein